MKIYTEDELQKMKERTNLLYKRMYPDEVVEDLKFTCDTCLGRVNCRSVYDIYNTNGDCLEDK